MAPDLAAAVLLGLAAYRSYRLVAVDELTAPLRARVHLDDMVYEAWSEAIETAKADGEDCWADKQPPPFSRERYYFARFARCPWCIGAWLSIVWWACWLAAPGVTIAVATLATISAIVGLVEINLDKE